MGRDRRHRPRPFEKDRSQVYVVGGLVLVYTFAAQNQFMAGNGWGIIVQGGFLFIFDLLHALAVPRREAPLPRCRALGATWHYR
jgi:uncharacterized membrane protein YecN with MAPEG domain